MKPPRGEFDFFFSAVIDGVLQRKDCRGPQMCFDLQQRSKMRRETYCSVRFLEEWEHDHNHFAIADHESDRVFRGERLDVVGDRGVECVLSFVVYMRSSIFNRAASASFRMLS